MKVLLGIGGSEDSIQALDRVIERTIEAGDDLTIAIVENPDSPRTPEEVRERALEALEDANLDANLEMLSGHPGSELLELAEREEFDRIVLGGGQTSPLGKVQLGSIAEFVILNARTSVTLIR
ncbi:MAG: universal stress protein [Natronomonas sp.]